MRYPKVSRFNFQFHAGWLIALLAVSGCSKKTDVKSQVSELEKAFPAAVPSAAVIQPEQQVTPPQSPPGDPNAYVKAALSAVRADDYAGGVIALQTAETMHGVTAPQLMAIARTKQAMTADLISRADRGDAKAKADLAAIEKTRSQ
jgi:hypothetical protein